MSHRHQLYLRMQRSISERDIAVRNALDSLREWTQFPSESNRMKLHATGLLLLAADRDFAASEAAFDRGA